MEVETLSIEFTKKQWEEIYQWYLYVKDEYNLDRLEIDVGEKIKAELINKFGSFT